MPIATVNPANGETLKTYEAMGEEELERRLQLAEATFRTYRTTPFGERARLLHRAAGLLDDIQQDIARVMTTEMGKPIKQARAEAAKCAKAMRWYADHAEELLADEEPADADVKDSGGSRVLVRYRPLGPVLAVMPWNFPLWQVIRFAAPALMAGNVGLLKHASNVPQTALFLEDLFHRAGYPEGCFQTLLVGSGAVDDLLRDDRVKAATLTGSEPAGRAVASTSGEMIKKTVLELGGSDPYVVMPSADVDRAARIAVTARVQNNGQSCIAAKRFIVHTDVYDRFTERFVEGMKALKVGDPMEEDTEVGPLSSEQGRADLEEARRRRQAQRGAGAVRRPSTPPARAARLVLPADRHRRDHTGDADPPRGGLRARRHPVSRIGSRRGRAHRQRLAVRAEFERVDAGRGGGRPVRTGPGGGRRVLQRHDRLPSGVPVRRGQAVRVRA